MAEDLFLDPRLPCLVEIKDPIRQQIRRITRRSTPCVKCHRPLTPDDLCFADGHDAHRSCAEIWNFELFDSHGQLMDQDRAEIEAQAADIEAHARSVSAMGLVLPNNPHGGELWTPPSATPAVTVPAA
jgi:hypothetical protein